MLLLALSLPRTLVLLLALMLLISLVLLALFLLEQHELECKPTLQAADDWGPAQVRVRSSAAACCCSRRATTATTVEKLLQQ